MPQGLHVGPVSSSSGLHLPPLSSAHWLSCSHGPAVLLCKVWGIKWNTVALS